MTTKIPWLRCLFLIAALTATSGFKFRCWIFCIDQTAIQNDYVDARDRCRENAQLKLDMAMHDQTGPMSDKSRRAMLVTLFSECMSHNGWSVPDGREDGKQRPAAATAAAAAAPVAAAAATAATVPPPEPEASVQAYDNAYLEREADCAFARQAASASHISALRAKACDIECTQRLKAAPEAPRPAACPPEAQSNMASGAESE